mmetsp:Transcript_50582/g.134619  ORF Transcript_50582/g.134619 Transcript_50582/m.134619 type:complete len:287 (-) Transcript_50582:369-1229(-)
MPNLCAMEPDLMLPSRDNLQQHERVRLIAFLAVEEGQGFVVRDGPLRLRISVPFLALALALRFSVLLRFLDGSIVVRRTLSTTNRHGNLYTTSPSLCVVFPVLALHLLPPRQGDGTVDQRDVILLRASLLDAVLAFELISNFLERQLRLRSNHDARGLLVQTVAATRLGACTVPAAATDARFFLLTRLPPGSGFQGRLEIVLESHVLVNLDFGLVAIQKNRTAFRSSALWDLVVSPAIGTGVPAWFIHAQDQICLPEQLWRRVLRAHLTSQHEIPVALKDLSHLLL